MSEEEASGGAALQIGFALILGVAVLGFFVGTGDGEDLRNPLVTHGVADEEVTPAPGAMPSYAMIRGKGRGQDSDWASERKALSAGGSGEALVGKTAALTDRAANRAYDGAPPTIPHPVRQRAAAECLACHEDTFSVRGKSASAMSHAEYASCTQCHVVSEAPMPGAMLPPDATFAANSFVGMVSPSEGERAWAIAPPTTPHHTSMRENCMSCHGPNGRDPMVTPHPERQSCQQCHPPSAGMDQAPGGAR